MIPDLWHGFILMTMSNADMASRKYLIHIHQMFNNKKGKVFPLQARCGPEGE